MIKLRLQNFGPVLRGTVAFRPLTIFIGPNGSGKSYTAMAFYAFYQGLVRAGLAPDVLCSYYNLTTDGKVGWEEWLRGALTSGAEAVKAEFLRVFGKPLDRLATWGKDGGVLELEFAGRYLYRLSWPSPRLEFEGPPCAKMRDAALRRRLARLSAGPWGWSDVVYLPASRGGLMQTYYLYVDTALRLAELFPLMGKAEAFPGLAADFVRLLLLPLGGEAEEYEAFRRRLGVEVVREERAVRVKFGDVAVDVRE
ncbi:MAG: hypothetical protein QXK63_06745, partial [Thermoproteus sp.]